MLALFSLAGCGQGSDTRLEEGEKNTGQAPAVYTVNYPLFWMAEQLVGDVATVKFPAPTGVDPAFWRPDVATVLKFQQADLVLLNGAGYAKWVANASLPGSRLVDTSAAYSEQLLAADAGPAHTHGPAGEHSHGELAFTTWLDLDLARQQAEAVAIVLQGLLPEESRVIKQRLAALLKELDDIDVRLTALGQQLDGVPLLYSHPVYQYLQRRYLLNGKALHWEPDQIPDATQWRELAELLRSHPARIMLWEDEPLPQVATRLGEMGIQVVVFSPLGNRPEQGDLSSNLGANIQTLEAALE
jgi:zinc transport system substrate-binding protein